MRLHLKKLPLQVIVLTGATSGIGLVTARKAAAQGATLVLVGRNETTLKQLHDELQAKGAKSTVAIADVGNEDDVNKVAEIAIQRFGRIDTWINCAGVGIFGRYEEVSIADMRRVMETNFWGTVYGSLAAVRYMKSRGGALINVGSGFSDRAAPLQGIYSASKYAVKGFTDSLRMELEKEGAPISVTLIKPASIDTMFVGHAKNYLEVEPKLPPPVYAPDIVADAILHAATHAERDISVGGAAKALAASEHYLPRIVDKVMERLMFRLQRSNRPRRSADHHILYAPDDALREREGVSGRVRETSLYTYAVTHPKVKNVLVISAGLALAAAWQMRRQHAR